MKTLKDFINEAKNIYKNAALKQNEIIGINLDKFSYNQIQKLIDRREKFIKKYIEEASYCKLEDFINAYLEAVESNKKIDSLNKSTLQKYLACIWQNASNDDFNIDNDKSLIHAASPSTKRFINYENVIGFFKNNKNLKVSITIDSGYWVGLHDYFIICDLCYNNKYDYKHRISFYFRYNDDDEIEKISNLLDIEIFGKYQNGQAVISDEEKAENKYKK